MIEAHDRLGHPNVEATREMVKELGLNAQQAGMQICQACTLAKANQKNVVQFSQHERSKVLGERLFIDLSSVKPPDSVIMIPYQHWCIIVDECTNFKASHFYQKKDRMAVSYLKGGEAKGLLLSTYDWIMQVKTSCLSNVVRVLT